MASHRVNVFDRLVSESGLVGIHKHKVEDRDASKIPRPTAVKFAVKREEHEIGPIRPIRAKTHVSTLSDGTISMNDGWKEGASSMPTSKANSPLGSPQPSSPDHQLHMDHLDIDKHKSDSAPNVFSRLTERAGFTGTSKYSAITIKPELAESKVPRPRTARYFNVCRCYFIF